jgi:hypothetical protein
MAAGRLRAGAATSVPFRYMASCIIVLPHSCAIINWCVSGTGGMTLTLRKRWPRRHTGKAEEPRKKGKTTRKTIERGPFAGSGRPDASARRPCPVYEECCLTPAPEDFSSLSRIHAVRRQDSTQSREDGKTQRSFCYCNSVHQTVSVNFGVVFRFPPLRLCDAAPLR